MQNLADINCFVNSVIVFEYAGVCTCATAWIKPDVRAQVFICMKRKQ